MSDRSAFDLAEILHQLGTCSSGNCDAAAMVWTLDSDLRGAEVPENEPKQTPHSSGERSVRRFIAMNRFKVNKGSEREFEDVWLNRDVRLQTVPGFMSFNLLRGPERDDYILYSSHTVWTSEAAFIDWTHSIAFRLAHRNAGNNKPLYDGHPEFEGFSVLQEIKP